MKKLIAISTIFILAGILFSSCKYNRSILKRHYNKGYYVANSNNKKGILTNPKEGKPDLTKKTDQPYSNQKTLEVKQPIYDNFITATNERVENKSSSHKKASKTINEGHKIKNMISQPKHTLLELKKVQSRDTDGGLSLFWIVILVILILWALGFLAGGFGLGGLINILLVVALILLILWLLRIV